MAKRNSLDDLIYDLNVVEKGFNYILLEKYNDIIAQLVIIIGQTTAYDTGLVRDLLSNILYDLGRPELVSKLEYQMYEFWKTRTKREQENSDYSFNRDVKPTQVSYSMKIDDYGFANQQSGKISSIHPRQDNNVIPHNVDYTLDLLETGSNKDIEKIFSELVDMIINAIEKGV